MSKSTKKILSSIFILLAATIALRFGLYRLLTESYPAYVRVLASIAILLIGTIFVLTRCAEIIEETTDVLSEKTHLAGGLLQSMGTALPDMILGVSAAFISLSIRHTDYARSIDFAIIAAAATFGSNIYNIGHAAWCIWRQNVANTSGRITAMFPYIKVGGELIPMKDHDRKPTFSEFNTANRVLISLTVITTLIAITMVLFGRIASPPGAFSGDLYQLTAPVALFIFSLAVCILIIFRKAERPGMETKVITQEENQFRHNSIYILWFALLCAAISILFTAESMVHAIEVLSTISQIPYVIAGTLAGIIGCLGEMIVVHKFSINPNGRIGDAIVGVAMDNIITITGASIVAIMGGIFLGGSSLIIIFVLILGLNSILIWQISDLKNFFLKT